MASSRSGEGTGEARKDARKRGRTRACVLRREIPKRGIKAQFPRAPEITRASPTKSGNEALASSR